MLGPVCAGLGQPEIQLGLHRGQTWIEGGGYKKKKVAFIHPSMKIQWQTLGTRWLSLLFFSLELQEYALRNKRYLPAKSVLQKEMLSIFWFHLVIFVSYKKGFEAFNHWSVIFIFLFVQFVLVIFYFKLSLWLYDENKSQLWSLANQIFNNRTEW